MLYATPQGYIIRDTEGFKPHLSCPSLINQTTGFVYRINTLVLPPGTAPGFPA